MSKAMSITAFTCSIFFFAPVVGIFLSVLGVIFGFIGYSQDDANMHKTLAALAIIIGIAGAVYNTLAFG